MANQDSGYFGMKLGEALSSGAGHIANALQRKYEMQKQNEMKMAELARQDAIRQEDIARQQQAQQQQTQMQFASQGLDYDPNNPAGSFEQFASTMKQRKGMEAQGQMLGQQKTQAEIARLQSPTMGREQTPPPGYRFLPSGDLESVPGGPADMKIQEAEGKKAQSLETMKFRAQNVIDIANKAIQKVGYNTAGFAGPMMAKIGGTEAADLEADIKTIQANLGFDRLTQMRAESPTGGALGQVSNIELELLTSAVTNLSQKQTPTQLKENLEKVKTHLANWSAILEKAKAGGDASSSGQQMGDGIQTKTLKDGSQVRVRRAADGSWEEVD